MEAYEFYATPENGSIVIPTEYRGSITSAVRVILLNQSHRSSGKRIARSARKSEMLLPPTMKTNGWRFDREAANER